MANYDNSILIDFNMIIDMDYGLIKLMNDKYSKSKYVLSFMLDLPDDILLHTLTIREQRNPIFDFINSKYENQSDNLYEQFMDQEIARIYEYAQPTDLLNLVRAYLKTDAIDVTVFCKNQQEQLLINKYLNPSENLHVIVSIIEDINISKFDSIYIKYYEDFLKFKNLQAKNLYTANCKYNLEKDKKDPIPLLSVSGIIGGSNKISLIDLYSIDQINKPIG